MRRIIYLGYYIKTLDVRQFRLFLNHVHHLYGISRLRLLNDCFTSSLKYNISLLEYFQFRFYEKEKSERKTYAGTGYMYEYQRIMNPAKSRVILDDKRKFYRYYERFFRHKVADAEELQSDSAKADFILNNKAGKIVLKVYNGQCGRNILVKKTSDFEKGQLANFLYENGFDLAEEFIIQHPSLSELSPSAVNTVRIYTQLNSSNEVEVLGCRLRISINSIVDNMAAGNMAAPVDEETGVITGPGVYSNITHPPEYNHPVTGTRIPGFQIPFWRETITMAREAALVYPENRSIGWDIAVTKNGPDLIEGNHDWCKLVWQLPVNKGLKPILERHLSEYYKLLRKK